MQSREVRKRFIDFFAGKGHLSLPSSSLIPQKDPTLLFTNAGMVQFKSVFLGLEEPPTPRAVTSQKCVRAGGKHNDLENVGRTARHHTFFEMLGNFSFGDYFKRDAILWAWEFLTQEMSLPLDKLWVTVYTNDNEAAKLWKDEAAVPANRIVRLGDKDNFWSMGDTGPCGPCSEILIDQGPNMGCGKESCAVGCDCDRYLELWNLVFMQYNRDEKGQLTPLPKPSIDTGMGLERLSAVMQGKTNNFDADTFRPIIESVETLCGKAYGANSDNDVSLRVIADHIRSLTFLLADGLLPSNDGRGYVMRRILRRAARHGKMLGLDEPFLYQLAGDVIKLMGDHYPELAESPGRITKILKMEEERFSNTLKHGLSILDELIDKTRRSGSETLSGKDLFRLYDTYGFPLDLAEDIALEAGLRLDHEGFNREMNDQKIRARASWTGAGEAIAPVYRELSKEIQETKFIGYEKPLDTEAKVLAIVKGGKRISEIGQGDTAEVFLDRTTLYGESGGQVGDTGLIKADGLLVRVLDTKKPLPNLYAHHVKVEVEGKKLSEGMPVTVYVDAENRASIMRNHTATHLLQAALREVLGEHVKQAGSFVAPEKLRFDFTHFSQLSHYEIEQVEDWVNDRILENLLVSKEEMSIKDAMTAGAMALFGEKYGDRVRVVSVVKRAGEKIEKKSSEFCGGTHVGTTGEIGLFKIISDSSVASGVRRIEAITGRHFLLYVRKNEAEIQTVAELLKAKENPAKRLKKLIEDGRAKDRELETLKAHTSVSKADSLMQGLREISGIKTLAGFVEGVEPRELRGLVDSIRDKIKSGAVLVASVSSGQAALVCMVTKDIAGKKLHAGNILKNVAARVGARGGGRPDMAQGGLKDVSKVQETLETFYEIVEKELL